MTAYIDEHKRSLDEHHGHSLLQEWLEQRQSDNVSFGEEKLVQGPEQSRRLSSVLLHALQKITVVGLVSVAAYLSSVICQLPCCNVPAEAASCYLVHKASHSFVLGHIPPASADDISVDNLICFICCAETHRRVGTFGE